MAKSKAKRKEPAKRKAKKVKHEDKRAKPEAKKAKPEVRKIVVLPPRSKPAQKTEQAREPVEHGYVPEPKPEAPATWQCTWCGFVQSVDVHQCGKCMQARG
jgi:hypothetical protein